MSYSDGSIFQIEIEVSGVWEFVELDIPAEGYPGVNKIIIHFERSTFIVRKVRIITCDEVSTSKLKYLLLLIKIMID